jgi:hypothetical protein
VSQPRRAQPKVSLKATGVVYLLHFHEPLGTAKHSIRHYLSISRPILRPVWKSTVPAGVRVSPQSSKNGVSGSILWLWPGNRQIENALKLHSATRICPECTPAPRTPLIVKKAIEAEERRQAREARKEVQRAREAQWWSQAAAAKQADPYQHGAGMAERFIRGQVAAGRTAEQIAATYAYITGPWRKRAHTTQVQAEMFRGYSEMVASTLASLRDAEAALVRAGPAEQRETEPEAG